MRARGERSWTLSSSVWFVTILKSENNSGSIQNSVNKMIYLQRAERSREVSGAPAVTSGATAPLTPRTPIATTPRAQQSARPPEAPEAGIWSTQLEPGAHFAHRPHVHSHSPRTPRTPSMAHSYGRRGSQGARSNERFYAEEQVSDRSRESAERVPASADATPRLATLEDALQRNCAQVVALRTEMRHWENSTAERLAARLHAHVQLEFDRCDRIFLYYVKVCDLAIEIF